MKTKITNTIGILALAATMHTASAQTVPSSFSYQAVITAEDGTPVSNQDITVEVSIRQGTDCETNIACPVLWQELHAPKTNDFGSFSIEIGDPAAINTTSGTLDNYSKIDWLNTANGYYYMQVRVDFGKASYLNGMTDLGTTKFSSVPYALAAETAESAKGIAKDANGKIGNYIGELKDVTIDNAQKNQILVFDGSAWKNTAPAAAQGLTNIEIKDPKTGDILVYNATSGLWENKTPSSTALNDLDDVKIQNTNNKQALIYNSTSGRWENKNITIETLNDVLIETNTDGQVLTYNAQEKKWKGKLPESGSSVTKLAQLTGDVTISAPENGQVLKYYVQNGKAYWRNEDASANDVWKVSADKDVYVNTTLNNVGIGTDKPLTPLHVKASDGNDLSSNQIMLNGYGITMGYTDDRCKGTGILAMGGTHTDTDKKISTGTACIVGNGSYTGGQTRNAIVMGVDSYSSSGAGKIIIGDYCSTGSSYCALVGNNLSAITNYQYIFGKNNVTGLDLTFVVANGTTTTPKNIFAIDKDGNLTNTGTINGSSDSRLKTNINTMTSALENVLKLRGVTFNWKQSFNPNSYDKTQFGFIAQEVEKVMPELVGTDSNGYKTVNYIGVIPVLTEAIKTQQEEIETLKSENETLKNTLEQLLKRVEALENR